jgi:hypothetical protein
MIKTKFASLIVFLSASLVAGGCGSDTTGPTDTSDTMVLTASLVRSLDSAAQVMVLANPGNADLKALVDSTLLVLTAGAQAKRLDVATNLTTTPLFFVGVHRAVSRSTGSYSTWTLVGFDDPGHLTSLVEVSGFAQTSGSTPPSSVSGTIGDGLGIVNSQLLQVASGGAVTQWRAGTGSASFSSDAPGSSCPGFTPVAAVPVTCGLETMHVHFSANATGGSNGAGARQAAVTTDVGVPTMRLTYTP